MVRPIRLLAGTGINGGCVRLSTVPYAGQYGGLVSIRKGNRTAHVLGGGLAAGQGIRLRPLTLKAEGYIRSKATVRFLGERIVTWMLHTVRRHGRRMSSSSLPGAKKTVASHKPRGLWQPPGDAHLLFRAGTGWRRYRQRRGGPGQSRHVPA